MDEVKQYISGPIGLQPFKQDWSTKLYIDFSGLRMDLVLTQCHLQDPTQKSLVWCDSSKLMLAQEKYLRIYKNVHPTTCIFLSSCNFICQNTTVAKIDYVALMIDENEKSCN